MSPCSHMLVATLKLTTSREMLIWMIPSEVPNALHAGFHRLAASPPCSANARAVNDVLLFSANVRALFTTRRRNDPKNGRGRAGYTQQKPLHAILALFSHHCR